MVELTALWIPIVVSAILVFVASSVMHMVLPHHKGDYRKLPSEEEVLEGLRKVGIPPGDYSFPRPADFKDMGSPAMQEKFAQGPVGFLTVIPSGPPRMGKSLVLWFLYSVVISIFAGYLASRTLSAGAEYLSVFRVVGTAAFLGYAGSEAHSSIWFGRSWGTTIKNIVDGLVYCLLTAGTFAWLWP